ncbi:hypothetical protein QO209_31045 [Pseudomonas citronellolis]|uniref:hypothetical protein n=1 Tax=Pseudomonas citronellolis TaxID=53408 RepID=UPI0026475E01|nr:hypothetical protein [Pseudomonas citronellolis]MDN6876903.1 hypothetical protein [Pseudomonas citronellolis]
METDFPEIEEPCEADAWQEIVHCEHKLNHDDLDRLMAEFLANGGAVQEIGFGQRTDLVPVFNGQFIHKSSPLERLHEAARRHSLAVRLVGGDEELVKRMDAEVDSYPSRSHMMRALHASNDRIVRLINKHFRDDPRFRRMLTRKDINALRAWEEFHEQPSAA